MLFRKVIKIRAVDSPNVRYALAEIAAGKTPSNKVIVPGVITWQEYQLRRATWESDRQTVGLDAEFYEGAEVMLYPADWIQQSRIVADQRKLTVRDTIAVSCDPGEGSANTAMAAVGERGVVEVVGKKTPDTSVIDDDFIRFMERHNVPPERAIMDRGGGGKQIADRLRKRGYNIRTIGFGEAIALPPKIGTYLPKYRALLAEQKYAYINRRAQMYGDLRILLDPLTNDLGFGIPLSPGCAELVNQMKPIPRIYDQEDRLIVPPKHRKPGSKQATMKSLEEIIGHSPDELDAVVMAVHALLYDDPRPTVGPIWSPNNVPLVGEQKCLE